MIRIGVAALLLAALLSAFVPGRGATAARLPSAGVSTFVGVEKSAPVYDVLWRYGHNDAAPNGAFGVNIKAPHSAWFIEEQRAGATDVIDGVFRHEPETLAEGLKMFHFGLARQAADGSFPGSAWPFHGTAMFLSEAAPSLLVLKSSDYAGEFSKELKWETTRMQKAAYYMVRSVGGAGKIDDTSKNHRYYEAAIALGSVGVLAGDSTLRTWSTLYAWKGVHMERPGGVMPEDGGHDSGYQALGMVNASRYLTLVATGKLESALYTALKRGEAWELSRVKPDGSINQSGDTRTVDCKEKNPAGQCKTVFYAPIYDALARWAAISGNDRYARVSQLVWHRSGYGG
jgi:hypothetical protein